MTLQVTEFQVPVPWGQISGLQFGTDHPGASRWLGIHGWLDNSATWTTLVPYLPQEICLVAIDLPGHGGRSDRLPRGVHCHDVEHVSHVYRVIRHLRWDR